MGDVCVRLETSKEKKSPDNSFFIDLGRNKRLNITEMRTSVLPTFSIISCWGEKSIIIGSETDEKSHLL